MKRKFLSALLGLWTIAVLVASAGADDFKPDPVHSFVIFRIHHFGAGYVYGTFLGPTGAVSYDAADPTKSSFDLTVKADSVDTRSDARDKDLKGADFFDVKQFPEIKFKSTAVKMDGDKMQVTGDLTVHGKTKSITIPMDMTGTGSLQGHALIGFETTFTINRSDFGMTFDAPPIIGDDVRITVAIEADK